MQELLDDPAKVNLYQAVIYVCRYSVSVMDQQTITTYETGAKSFCAQYRAQTPTELYDVIKGFFHRHGETADIGCGCGRDSTWMSAAGFRTTGYDASSMMVDYARTYYPTQSFQCDSLPALASIAAGQYANILCSAVLMHLLREDLITAVINLARILQSEGRLVLTYRESHGSDEREEDGRLFTAIPMGKLMLLLESAGFRIVSVSKQQDSARPEVQWSVILAEKGPADHARGLERIQRILVQDAKVATYKLALVRAFCKISRTQAHIVHWGQDVVYVPMWSVAVQWLIYYWPLLTSRDFIAQIRGESSVSTMPIAFRGTIMDLSTRFGAQGLWSILQDMDGNAEFYFPALKKIAQTIEKGPVTYAGTKQDAVFHFSKTNPGKINNPTINLLGWIGVPENIWLDICRFNHWIEDSVIMRWCELSALMNPVKTVDQFVPYLLSTPGDERDTSIIRSILLTNNHPIECVWTGKALAGKYHVDHVIPYSVWGNNDYWNLLPCQDKVNSQKSDSLPTHSLIHARTDSIVQYWQFYRKNLPNRFDIQISRSLGCVPGEAGWERAALAGLQETIQRIEATRGLAFWQPR